MKKINENENKNQSKGFNDKIAMFNSNSTKTQNNQNNQLSSQQNSKPNKNKSSKFIGEESQNQIDQEKDIFYINYAHNQKLNPELKDLDISIKKNDTNEEDNNNIDINISNNNNINNNIECEDEDEEFVIENIKTAINGTFIRYSGLFQRCSSPLQGFRQFMDGVMVNG